MVVINNVAKTYFKTQKLLVKEARWQEILV